MTHLLDMPVKDLLKEFGKGKGMTGAGASVALGAIAATQILVSVCKLTSGKETYAAAHEPLAGIQQKLEAKYIPVLEAIMQADAAAVENMLRMRLARDNEPDEAKKEALKQQAEKMLEGATATMLKLCNTCIDIIPLCMEIYDIGLKSAKGDTGMAFSSLLSAASSGLYATLINIKSAKGATWTVGLRDQVQTCFGRLHEYQYIFSGRLAAIYNEVQ